jgi:glycosyltransferase involved in cell wall biosynthesis
MAMGLPCLCTDIPESVETGGDAVAYAPARDPEALAQALRALVDDPPRRAALGLRGRARSQRYAATAIARRYLAGIERVLAARGPGRAP